MTLPSNGVHSEWARPTTGPYVDISGVTPELPKRNPFPNPANLQQEIEEERARRQRDKEEELPEQELDERAALAAIFEEAQELHFHKRDDYVRGGKDGGDDLGAAGQYAELHRKDAKLRKSLWEGQALTGEQPREVLLDLIGHAVKAIRYLDTENLR